MQWLDVALAAADKLLLLLHLQEELLALLLGELIELALALAFFLFRRDFSYDAVGGFGGEAVPVCLGAIRHLGECELVGSELVRSCAWLLLSQELVVLGLLCEKLCLDVVGLLALLHLTELMSQCLASLVRLRALLASFSRFFALRYQIVEHRVGGVAVDLDGHFLTAEDRV